MGGTDPATGLFLFACNEEEGEEEGLRVMRSKQPASVLGVGKPHWCDWLPIIKHILASGSPELTRIFPFHFQSDLLMKEKKAS